MTAEATLRLRHTEWYVFMTLMGLLPHVVLHANCSMTEQMILMSGVAAGVVASYRLLREGSPGIKLYYAVPFFVVYSIYILMAVVGALSDPVWIVEGWQRYLVRGSW